VLRTRRLRLDIDRRTWNPPVTPPFPANFTPTGRDISIDLQEMLLKLGVITTPQTALGMSLAEHWAWFRYFFAFTNNPADESFTLTPEYAQLDAHQKTILSDDLGMAVPVYWLSAALGIPGIPLDGSYFVKRMAHLIGRPPVRTNKRGPLKTPDFVMRDTSGRWHVLECKGTQSSRAARNKQLSHLTSGGQPNGAVVQKTMIGLRPNIRGQRLGSGLFIGIQGGRESSHLKLVDPEYKPIINVREEEEPYLEDAAIRGTISKALIFANLPSAGSAFASPEGFLEYFDYSSSLQFKAPPDRGRFSERAVAARIEIEEARQREKRVVDGETYFVRDQFIPLPRPLILNEQVKEMAIVSTLVSSQALDAIESTEFKDDALTEKSFGWATSIQDRGIATKGSRTTLKIGKGFRVELSML